MTVTRRSVIHAGIGTAGLLIARASALRAQQLRFDADPFTLGVASGYPEPGAVTLWTRLAPAPLQPAGGMSPSVVAVDWEVAADDRFRRVVRTGTAYAAPDWAHSVHAEVTGLAPGRDYWFRFRSGNAESAIGRTRTAPAPGAMPQALAIAVACCQHYESGYWAAYREIAGSAPDLVVHVGDYIYENRGIRPRPGLDPARSHDLVEPYTLDDYRTRYALYKLDPYLQTAHASAPWIVTPDDHEVDNDYANAISEHNDDPALFLARRAAAYQAYYEHMPMPRRHVPSGPNEQLFTVQAYGSLVDLLVLDGRQYRSDQVCNGRLAIDCAEVFDAGRTMLGERQERWVDATLAASRSRWTLIAQQTVFAHMDQAPGDEVGYWADGWSGYAAARQRMVDRFAMHGTRNPVILGGDIHGFLVNDVHARPGDPSSPVAATELVTTSISSNGPAQTLFDGWRSENPNVHFARSDRRGYTHLTVTPDSLQARLIAVDDPRNPASGTHTLATYRVDDGHAGVQR